MTPIYASQVTYYLAANTEQDAQRAVRKITRQLQSGRGFNWWQGPSNALVTDRSGTRDGQALFAAAESARPDRKISYREVAEAWAQLAPWWEGLQHERLPGQTVYLGNLLVRVPRLCAERHPDGTLEVLYPRWSKEKLPRHVMFGLMRIAQLAHPDAEVTFVDIPRLATLSSRDRDLTKYDEWLQVTGDDLAQLLDDGQDQAAAA